MLIFSSSSMNMHRYTCTSFSKFNWTSSGLYFTRWLLLYYAVILLKSENHQWNHGDIKLFQVLYHGGFSIFDIIILLDNHEAKIKLENIKVSFTDQIIPQPLYMLFSKKCIRYKLVFLLRYLRKYWETISDLTFLNKQK